MSNPDEALGLDGRAALQVGRSTTLAVPKELGHRPEMHIVARITLPRQQRCKATGPLASGRSAPGRLPSLLLALLGSNSVLGGVAPRVSPAETFPGMITPRCPGLHRFEVL